MDCPTYEEDRQKLFQNIVCKSEIVLPHARSEVFHLILSCPVHISAYVGQFIYNSLQKRDNAL